jgi:hypothetical protein
LRELALHLLDIAHNSVSAHARNIKILVDENSLTDRLRLSVEDDGAGMSPELVQRVTDPFTTSRTTRNVGLGIPLLKAAAEACNGHLEILSTSGVGTKIEVEFQRSHIDRMPLGNLSETFYTLAVGCPDVHWVFKYRVDGQEFEYDDAIIKQELQDVPLTEPSVLEYLKELMEKGILEVTPQPQTEGDLF